MRFDRDKEGGDVAVARLRDLRELWHWVGDKPVLGVD